MASRGYYWFTGISGTLGAGDNATHIDVKNDLGIGDSNLPGIEAYAGIGRSHLSLMYTPLDYKGDAVVHNVIFANQTYNGPVHCELDSTMLDLNFQYDLFKFNAILAGISVGPVVGIKLLDGDVKLQSSTLNNKETFTVPVPMIGVGANVGFWPTYLMQGPGLQGWAIQAIMR